MDTATLTDEVRARAAGGISSDTIYRMVVDNFEPADRGAKILDFGCGHGDFLTVLAQHGFASLSGVDIIENPLRIPATATYTKCNLNKEIAYLSCSFDLVFSVEVIEHLENPRAMLREIARLLRPGGRLFLTTPNSENLRGYISLIFRRHFWAFHGAHYPAHITALLELDLRRMVAEAGLVVDKVVFTDRGGIVGFPGTTWQKWLGRRARGRYFSDNLLVVARKPG